MSLVVAKQLNNEIYIVSDTKLTYVDIDNHPEQTVAAPDEGIIKATLINPHVCICFAGEIDGVDGVLAVCRRTKNVPRILTILDSFHKSHNQRTDFIVAISLHPVNSIFEIKGGKIIKTHNSWIGSKTGFSEFQKYFSAEENLRMGLDWRMGKALKMVMESSIDPTVNGFLISLTTRDGLLYYNAGMDISIVPQVVQGNHAIGHGSPQKGGYSIHYFPPSEDFKVLPIHILQGNFGIVYIAEKSGLLRPTVIRNIDERSFASMLTAKYGIAPLGFSPKLEDLR